MSYRNALFCLLVGAILLPVAIVLLVGVAQLLSAMDDAAGAMFFHRVALLSGVVWVLDLVGTVLLLAIRAVMHEAPYPPDEPME